MTDASHVLASDSHALDLSFVVETVNVHPGDFSLLNESLARLSRQSLDRNRYEIIVVVDPLVNEQLPLWLADRWPDVRVESTPGFHYYAQKNHGARVARGRLVGFVDSDCLASEAWAASIVDLFNRRADQIGAGQGIYGGFEGVQAKAFAISTFGTCIDDKEVESRSLGASNCAFLRDRLVADPFNEAPFFHGPDVRKYSALKSAGSPTMYCPGAVANHNFEPGLGMLWQRGLNWGYCFVELRRDSADSVKYTRAIRALGPLAPFFLVPAKMILDVRRMVTLRSVMNLTATDLVGCTGLFVLNGFAVGIGAAMSLLRMPVAEKPY